MDLPLAARTKRMESSLIRELLKLASRPGMISLAGGVPAPEAFPMPELKAASQAALEKHGPRALQYSPTEGHPVLRAFVAEKLGVDPDWVLITSGSQQAIDLVARVFLDEGDAVVVEAPTYMGGLLAMRPFGPTFVPVPLAADGPELDALPPGAKLAYFLPNFQNPTGALWSEEKREAALAWAEDVGAYVLEDDPYGHIYFEAPPPPPLFARAPERVIYAGTFSKLIAPGLRIGYVVARPEVLEYLIKAKQAADLHTNILGQAILAELVETGALEPQAERVRALYRRRRDIMAEALAAQMPDFVRWEVPRGGMFFWLRLPEGLDTRALLEKALEAGVAFVPGEAFFAGEAYPAARLTFASVDEAAIQTGVERLAGVLEAAS